MSWQDYGDDAEANDEPAVTLGDLRDGEGVTLTVDAEPETFDSDRYGSGVRVPSTFEASDYDFTTDEGDRIEAGDSVNLVTWSKRLVRALATHAEEQGGLVGETVRVTKHGSGMETTYSVESAE